jgi:hypothetical protein
MQIVFILFLWTVAVGAVLFAIAWLPTRKLARRSRIWRVLLSCIVALAITPTTIEFCGQWCIAPASFASLMLLAPDAVRRSIGLAYGVLPLVTFAAVVFCAWSYYVDRARTAI